MSNAEQAGSRKGVGRVGSLLRGYQIKDSRQRVQRQKGVSSAWRVV